MARKTRTLYAAWFYRNRSEPDGFTLYHDKEASDTYFEIYFENGKAVRPASIVIDNVSRPIIWLD